MPDSGTPADSGDASQQAPSPAGDGAGNDLLAALATCQSAWQQAQSWDEFIESLAAVEASAMQAGHLALHDVCVILRERLAELRETRVLPDEEQCAVLATWPSFASAWAESPGEPRLGELLVDFLRHPMWPQPLGDDEAEILGVMLGVESGAHGSASMMEVVIDTMYTAAGNAADKGSSADDGLPGYDGLSGYAKVGTAAAGGGKIVPDVRARMTGAGKIHDDEVEDMSAGMDLGEFQPDGDNFESINAHEEVDVHDSTEVEPTQAEPAEPQFSTLEITEPEFDEPVPVEPELVEPELVEPELAESDLTENELVEPELAEPEFAASDPLEAGFAESELTEHEPDQHEFVEPKSVDLESAVPYLVDHGTTDSKFAGDEFEESGFQDEDAGHEPVVEAPSEMPETAHEMIHLLIVEASQIATTLADIMPLATSETAGEGERREALEHFAEQVERFNGAVELLGLDGLCRVGQQFHQNIMMLSQSGDALTPELAELLVYMCTAVPEYLEHPADRIAGGALTSLLAHSSWPQPVHAEWAEEVEALLASPVVDVDDEDAEERAVRALPEDVSLELPGDVDMEVLDGLLQDLPGQTAEFSRTVATLVSGGTSGDVEVAQRIAHTVKGAANTVGVAGLANLTHHLEDILLALGKHGVTPGRSLGEVLVRAADCLESMGETLLGQCEPPTDALDTLQSVLDWANTIDNEGVAAVAGDAMPTVPRAEADTQVRESSPNVAPAASTPMVRVPAPLVDDLLRLVGETIILSGQIQERLSVTEREAQNMRKQYTLVQQLGQEMEELIDLRDLSLPQQRVVNGEAFDALEFDQYNELHTCSRRLVEAATDTKEVGQNIEEHLSALSDMLSDQGRLNRENQEAVLKTRMVAVQTIVPRLQRSVRQASRLTGKPVELRCIGADTLMDSDVLGRLLDPLMHVLRNAVDHGIEPESVRMEAGKDITGEIRLEFHREGNHIVVRCQDDGGGLDLQAIREAAKARDILAENEQFSDEELIALVLRPNFSTRAEATQLSGRGIGLDAVNMQVVGLGGSLRLQSEPNQGCQIIMRLPLTLISTHALLVRVTSHTMAVATRGVEQILHPDSGETSHFGDQTTYRMVDAVYPCTTLARLLGLPGERRAAERERCPALLVQGDNGLNVVLVDGVSDSRELVIKSMGRHLPKIRGIAGATILGDGSVTPVLDLPELLREPARYAAERPKKPGAETGIHVDMPYALVVDDSLSARRSLAQFMTDSGFQVRTARDGVEAVKIMQSRQPDLLLVDLEMPRMNGLELTHHVRANDATRDVPVIMITSRSTEKHRKQAEAAGVTQYLTKPYAEDELMEHVYTVCTR
jgi:chemotaxis protein histidine kinase CheA